MVSITNDTLAKTAISPLALNGTVNPATGLVKIVFGTGNANATITGYGAILENESVLSGYFVTKTNAGLILFQP